MSDAGGLRFTFQQYTCFHVVCVRELVKQSKTCHVVGVSPDEKVHLSVVTNKPAMQLYTGNWLAGAPNRRGGEYNDYAGLALETQFLPDSPNHAEWAQPSCILEPEQEYRFCTTYQFAF